MRQPRYSHSQYKEYVTCPYRWYLHRVLRAPERPAAWLSQGLGVHEAAEAYERSQRTMSLEDAQDVFRESYAKHTNRLAQDWPRFDTWFPSGPYRGSVDVERRYTRGLEQVARYVDYAERHPDETVWTTPDGTPAIELGCEVDLGGVRVRGYVDQVVQGSDGPVVRDVKTGKQPGDHFQLAVYAVMLYLQYGEEITTGDYWMGVTGKPTFAYPLSEWTVDEVASEFQWLDEQIQAERFEPKPDERTCFFCPVRAHCEFSA